MGFLPTVYVLSWGNHPPSGARFCRPFSNPNSSSHEKQLKTTSRPLSASKSSNKQGAKMSDPCMGYGGYLYYMRYICIYTIHGCYGLYVILSPRRKNSYFPLSIGSWFFKFWILMSWFMISFPYNWIVVGIP